MKPNTFYSNGKLLITGEYLILDGALALAIPTSYGQSLTVEPIQEHQIKWESYDHLGHLWFETTLSLNENFRNLKTTDTPINERLLQIMRAVKKYNPNFLNEDGGVKVKTQADFPRNWGLGTSSTLINNMAQWAKLDAYKLLEDTFGGSGYDIACAQHNSPLTYQLETTGRTIIERDFNPEFKQHLYFVFLNKKQNSREGIASYQNNKSNIHLALSEVNAITNDMIGCTTLETFQYLMQSHERIISKIIKQQPVKEMLFKDFKGSIKSLGAWGGDFVMVASEDNPEAYFGRKGFDTIIPYTSMIL
ncbi:mevalonate kinase [Gelidibacter algens]|uniref:Mevalonate kinase n=1 Tax=Gelidibacter algens TaxID=49280 RepID=A0A1A7QXD2_9FLAO|nr:GYDIA family GHMP kinase [Gelidibacter algens]OBX24216.1 GHMP kinase [Gelidibacter algens]RAJ22715.1 mevalonate kinase [Gelidibacter algens]